MIKILYKYNHLIVCKQMTDLINCDRFRKIHPKHYQTNNLKNLFKNSTPEEILSFLKEINFFIKIYSNIIKHNQNSHPKT